MVQSFTPRQRKVRILATLGPASATPEMIAALHRAGADAFRVNMSHGDHEGHAKVIAAIRALEKETGRPTTILVDLQGPKLRVGTFASGPVDLINGESFALDADPAPGDATRVHLPHPELFAALEAGQRLLIDDGKLHLRAETLLSAVADRPRLEVGGKISDRKGVNVPDVVVPLAALTEKDRKDLTFALEQHVDWIALSFVQRAADVAEARTLIGGQAGVVAKLEKPAAIAAVTVDAGDVSDGSALVNLGAACPP